MDDSFVRCRIPRLIPPARPLIPFCPSPLPVTPPFSVISMQLNGPTEEDSNYIADTGFSAQEMQDQVDAYRNTITQFNEAVYAAGAFTWMMMASRARAPRAPCACPARAGLGGGRAAAQIHRLTPTTTPTPNNTKPDHIGLGGITPEHWHQQHHRHCHVQEHSCLLVHCHAARALEQVPRLRHPGRRLWHDAAGLYRLHGRVPADQGRGASARRGAAGGRRPPRAPPPHLPSPPTTPGPPFFPFCPLPHTHTQYAILGYTWFGCTNGDKVNPRAAEWDEEFGAPQGTCAETAPGSGVFTREWTAATVAWDCNARHGSITRK